MTRADKTHWWPANTDYIRRARSVKVWHAASLLLGLLCCLLPAVAHASCNFTKGTTQSTVAFTLPGTLILPDNLPPGSQTVLWTSAPTTPNTTAEIHCNGTTNSGIQNLIGMQPAGDSTLFPTGVSNLYFQILYPDSPMLAYPSYPVAWSDQLFNQPFALQLVATGTITGGATLNTGQLAQWIVDMGGANQPVTAFQINNTVTITPPACSIITDPTVVTLPTVYASAFTGTDSTTGLTPFNVQLNCPSTAAGASLAVTLATSSPVAGATGVIANTAGGGYAQNVGVQVLDSSGNPIPFGTAISAGTVTAGTFNVPLNARYYQTGASVTAGQVNATATYTITYQ